MSAPGILGLSLKAFVEIQMKEAFQACFVAYVCDP
jgi:hypothetical protein